MKQHHIHLYIESPSDDLQFNMYKDEKGIICIATDVETTSISAVRQDIDWELMAQNLLDLALLFDTPEYIAERLKSEVGLNDDQLEWLGFENKGEEQ